MKRSKRLVVRVIPSNSGEWMVAYQEMLSFSKKSGAIKVAKEIAKYSRLGQVIIHGEDGEIQTEYTYGKDPKRRKG